MASSKLIFLGTGTSQGIPVIGSHHPVCLSSNSKDKRLRASAYIKLDELQLLIDCGPDFRQQMLSNNLSELDAILFTHEHNDHVIGLDDVRPIFFKQQQNIELYAQKNVLEAIKLRFPYSFASNKLLSVAGFNLNYIEENNPFLIKNVPITPIPVLHDNLPILGYRIKDLAYITDASLIENESLKKLNNLEVLILNVLRKKPKHNAHFILSEALEIVKKLQPKKTYFTHISHKLGFYDEVEKELPKNVHLAFDGLEINF